ncbi:MAG: hypothetical protein VKI42_01045 [Synechococcaceae cyanobacterium]|nr:hypothetical protein [Synechococcaceae cyanobacterium]
MCKAKAPKVVQTGPSPEDIAYQNQQLQLFMQQSAMQQEQFAAMLQQQIDMANSRAEQDRLLYEQELQAAAAMAPWSGSYRTTTAEAGADPALAQTTELIQPKQKTSSLAITPWTIAEAQGTGLNIGV